MTAKLNTVKLPRALVALLMGFAILLGTVATGLAVLETDAASSSNYAKDGYSEKTSGTVTWAMIQAEPGCYYWYNGSNYYVLSAVTVDSKKCVEILNLKSGDTRYLKATSDDDSGSKYDWGSSAHTGGPIYYKANIPASTLTLNKSSINVSVGNTGTVTATCSNCYVNGASSNNTSVTSVTYSGNNIIVTGIAPGTATITVSGKSNNSSSYTDPASKTFTVYVTGKYYGQLLYDANGGNEVPASSAITGSSDTYASSANVSIIISDDIPTKEGYNFLGWSTNSSATSADYQPGATYTITSSKSQTTNPEKTTLYAVWEDKIKVSNPSEVGDYSTKNLHISKELTKKDDGTYTIKIVTYGTKQTTTSTVNETKTMYAIQTGKSYTYSELANGKYYYRDGSSNTAYPITGYGYSSSRYYLTYVKNGTTYYITESGSTTSRSSGNYASSTSGTIFSNYSSGQIYSIEPQTYTSGESYVEVSNSSNITYSTIVNTPYYYKSGNQYYQLLGYSSSSKYYIYYYDGSKYYGLKNDASTKSDSSNKGKGDNVSSTSKTFLKKGFTSGVIYQKVSSLGGSATPTTLSVPTQVTTTTDPSISSGIIKDIIETSNFDVSNAQYKVTTQTVNYSGSLSGSETQTSSGSVSSNGTITTPSFNYSTNAASSSTTGTAEILTISGLKLKDGVYGDALPSNKGNAGIFANATTATPEVSITSPTVSVPKTEQGETYNLTVNDVYIDLKDNTRNGLVFLVGDTYAYPDWSFTINGVEASSGSKPNTINYPYTLTIKDTSVLNKSGNMINASTANVGQTTATLTIKDLDGNVLATQDFNITVVDTSAYTVNWKNGNSTLETDSDVKKNSKPSYDGSKPTKAATAQYTYTFSGWSTDPNATTGSAVSDLPAVTEDVTYYAVFNQTLRSYNVTFKNGNAQLQSGTINYGTKPIYNGNTPTKANDDNYTYTFDGWTTNADGSGTIYTANTLPTVTGATTYYAHFKATEKPKNYELKVQDVTFDLANNTFTGSPAAGYGEDEMGVPDEGYVYIYYTLNGVDYDSDSDHEYRFVFEAEDTSIVNFEPTGGAGTSDFWFTIYGTPGSTIVTAKLYDVTNVTNVEPLATTTFTVTVYPFNITFKNGDETLEETTASLKQSPQYTKAEPTKDGYTFLGWSTNPNATGEEGTYYPKGQVLPGATDNTTYYAVFEKNSTYTITWVNDDATILETDENVQAGATPSYDGATPTKASTAQYEYIFAGWTPEITEVNGDKTYTAVYVETPREYTVTFQYHDDTHVGDSWVTDTKDYAYGATPTAPSVKETIVDGNTTYTFTGWDKEISPVTGNVTYVAKYNVETFIPETDASTDKKLLPAVTLLTMLATAATAAVLAADPQRRRRRRDSE